MKDDKKITPIDLPRSVLHVTPRGTRGGTDLQQITGVNLLRDFRRMQMLGRIHERLDSKEGACHQQQARAKCAG